MLKIIATSPGECIAKHENKVRYNTDYDLAKIEKRSRHWLKQEIFISLKSIVQIKNWFVVSDFWEFPKHHTAYGKITFWSSYYLLKTNVKFTIFRLFS